MNRSYVTITANAYVRLVNKEGKEVKSFILSPSSKLDFDTIMSYNETKFYFKEKTCNLRNGEMFLIYEEKPDSIP